MSNTNRIIRNSLFLYYRMLFLMCLGFYTTRVVLEALGVEDLGISNVVGSLILMFDFVSSGLSGATQRFLNLGIGRGDVELTNKYFSQSLILHIIFIIVIALLVETIGLWFVYNKLVIPGNRFHAAVIVFHLSLVSLALRMFRICFESVIIARENMSIYAYFSVFEGLSKLLICLTIVSCEVVDRLILYTSLLLLLNISVTLFNVIYCYKKYPESHFRWNNEQTIFKEMLSFIGINSFGMIAWAFSKQGIDILINIFFGPVINGAKAIAANLDRVIVQFGSNLEMAVRPQITKYYAQGEFDKMVLLGEKGALYVFYVMFFISLPFLFQTDTILSLWLKEVPNFTAGFVRILIIENLFYCIATVFYNVTIATGKIKRAQLYGRLITLGSLPLSYLLLHVFKNEYLPSIIMAISSFIYTLFIIWDANTILKFGISSFIKIVYIPIMKVVSVVIGLCILINMNIYINNIFLRFAVLSLLYCSFALITVFFIGMDRGDRILIVNLIKNKVLRK